MKLAISNNKLSLFKTSEGLKLLELVYEFNDVCADDESRQLTFESIRKILAQRSSESRMKLSSFGIRSSSVLNILL